MRAHHYRWDDVTPDHPVPFMDRRRVSGEQAMVAQMRLGKGFRVDTHRHENEQFACVLSGHMRFGIGDPGAEEYHEVDVLPGEILHLPPNLPHSADALEDSVLFDIFSPPAQVMGVDMAKP